MGDRPIHCALALVSTLLGAPLAYGATATASIPAECGSHAALEAELRARLGDSLPFADLSVAITPSARGFHLQVALGAEHRELDDPSCRELFRAAVVIAVSMLMKDAERAPPAPRPFPAAPIQPSPRSGPDFGVGLGAGLGAGTLPKPVLALELEGKARWRLLGLGVSVRYLLPAERTDDTRQGANLSALGVGLTGIFRPSPAWEARLGFAAQRLFGKGVGTDRGYSVGVWAAGPTLGLSWAPLRRGPLWAGLGAEGQANLVRGRFEILNYSGEFTGERYPLFRVPWLAGSAFVRWGVVW